MEFQNHNSFYMILRKIFVFIIICSLAAGCKKGDRVISFTGERIVSCDSQTLTYTPQKDIEYDIIEVIINTYNDTQVAAYRYIPHNNQLDEKWFKIRKSDKNIIILHLEANTSSLYRRYKIRILPKDSGFYVTDIDISQNISDSKGL